MRKGTKIALAAGALTLVGAAALTTMATAEYRGSGNWSHHGKGHHGMGMRGMGHGGRGMHRMLERFDTNEDGKLTQEELDGARKKLVSTHDSDKDGKLSLAEYEKLWLEVKRQRMVRSFQKVDRDGDASVTVDEFLKPYAKIVERMDSNGDGALDRDDHRKRHGGKGRGHGGGMGKQDGSGGMGKRGG